MAGKAPIQRIALVVLLCLVFSGIPIIPANAEPDGSITYSAGTMTMTGFAEGSEGTFWDFWNASHINGWNVSCQTCENATTGIGHHDTQFLFDCELQIGDDGLTPTWFKDTNVQVTFTSSVTVPIYITENVHFTLGEVLDANAKTVQNGVSIYCLNPSPITVLSAEYGSNATNLYGCYFYSVGDGKLAIESDESYLWESTLDNVCLQHGDVEPSGTYDLYRVQIKNVAKGITMFAWGTLDDLLFCSCTDALYLTGAGATTYENLKARNCTYFVDCGVPTTDKYLINADTDNWAFNWFFLATTEVYRQYTFNLAVTDEDGDAIEDANVTLWNTNGRLGSWTTDANGDITEQTLSMGYYNQTGGDTIYSLNPHKLTVTHDDYDTYTKNFTLSDKTDWEICLSSDDTYVWWMLSLAWIPLALALFVIARKRRKKEGNF